MQWEKTITIRITIRRLVVAIVATSTVVNLVIVGTVVGAESPPTTSTPGVTLVLTTPFLTSISVTHTATTEETPTSTPSVTPTATLTATQTLTDTPGPTPCIKRSDWPTYRIQQGDTLYWLASATGSTVQELMLANCLMSDLIYRGQVLHVPRLPITTFTPTPTQTDTPTTPDYACDRAAWIRDVTIPLETILAPGTPFVKTWSIQNTGTCTWTTSYSVVYVDGESFQAPLSSMLPFSVLPGGTIDISLNMIAPSVPGFYGSSWMFKNANGVLFGIGEQANQPWPVAIRVQGSTLTPDSPISFQDHYVCQGTNNNTNLYLGFGVTLSDTQDVSSVTAYSSSSIVVPMQDTGGGVYAGTFDGSGGYSPGRVVPYYFIVQRKSGQPIRSGDLNSNLFACGPL